MTCRDTHAQCHVHVFNPQLGAQHVIVNAIIRQYMHVAMATEVWQNVCMKWHNNIIVKSWKVLVSL